MAKLIYLHMVMNMPVDKFVNFFVSIVDWDGRVSYIRLIGIRINVTLDATYCMYPNNQYIGCINGAATNYTYSIPLSRHMSDPTLTLQFQ